MAMAYTPFRNPKKNWIFFKGIHDREFPVNNLAAESIGNIDIPT